MARPDTEKVKKYREEYDYWQNWDVVLCVPWAEFEGVTPMHIRLYEQIGEAMESIGKTCFFPHRLYGDLENKEDFRKKNGIVGEIIVPTSDLILSYVWSMGTPFSYGIILSSATQNSIPELCFLEEEKFDEVHEPGELELILFKNHADCVKKLRQAVKDFYDRGMKFKRDV